MEAAVMVLQVLEKAFLCLGKIPSFFVLLFLLELVAFFLAMTLVIFFLIILSYINVLESDFETINIVPTFWIRFIISFRNMSLKSGMIYIWVLFFQE